MTPSETDKPDRTPAGRLLESLVLEILGAFFDLRAVGQAQGLVTEWGAGRWGLLRALKQSGPLTVPEMARMRAVSRQYIQKLANELLAEGLIAMADNPAHKRSKQMRLTPSGETELAVLTARFHRFLESVASGFREDELGLSIQTLTELRKRLADAKPGD